MGSRRDCNCWEIMQCVKSEECPARINPEKPCWEIIVELGDYRSACYICRDCIVRVLQAETSVLSEQEIKDIVMAKTGTKAHEGVIKTQGFNHAGVWITIGAFRLKNLSPSSFLKKYHRNN